MEFSSSHNQQSNKLVVKGDESQIWIFVELFNDNDVDDDYEEA